MTSSKHSKVKQDGFDVECNAKFEMFLKRKEALETNLSMVHSLIHSNYCTRVMQNRIEEHPDFDSKIRDDPIALLEAIKTLMHDTVRAQCPMVSMTDSLARLINIRQWENEDLLEHVK